VRQLVDLTALSCVTRSPNCAADAPEETQFEGTNALKNNYLHLRRL
jgi:hypothetical protein